MKSIFINEDLSAAEKGIIDDFNIPSLILMENAGRNAAEIISNCYFSNNCDSIIILSGKGNNAGDGFVIARHLSHKSLNVSVWMLYNPSMLKGDALTNFRVLEKLCEDNIHSLNNKTFSNFRKLFSKSKPLVVDSVYGIGFTGELNDFEKRVFGCINSVSNAYVVSVDIPSGLSDYLNPVGCPHSNLTISMGVRKFNTMFYTGRQVSGKIEVVDIGIPESVFNGRNAKGIYLVEKDDVECFMPVRDINSNKYVNGKLFIIGGSAGLSGAAYLSSVSALRAGCGAVILGLPEGQNSAMEAKTTEVMTVPLEGKKYLNMDSYEQVLDKIDWCDTLLIGPGLGKNPDTYELIRKIISDCTKNIVIDADAINAFRGKLDILKRTNSNIILTPHFGEFSRLLEIDIGILKSDFINISRNFSEKYNLTLVLKNSPTIIADGKKSYINPTGRENLATAGSGDVLSGIIAGYFAQTNLRLESALLGTYVHGLCGDIIYSECGPSSTIASDLIDKLKIIKNLF